MGKETLENLTLIVPYYRNPLMLERQILEWNIYPDGINLIVVDDGSPEPARPIVEATAAPQSLQRIQLYRILEDKPWNRGGARNLGAMVATTDWIMHVDIDHLLPAKQAEMLFTEELSRKEWYRFERYRRGRADATRQKDQLRPETEYGPIHPHIDSYLCTHELYWRVGGYDEDYSGCLGGGTPFVRMLEKYQPVKVLPVHLEVFTRSEIPDASDLHLSRAKEEYTRRKRAKEAAGNTKPQNPLRFKWQREL